MNVLHKRGSGSRYLDFEGKIPSSYVHLRLNSMSSHVGITTVVHEGLRITVSLNGGEARLSHM